MRLSATVPLLALGSLSLVAVAGPAGSAPVPLAAPAAASVAVCNHEDPITTAEHSQRLSQPTSAKDSRPLGQALGEGVAAAVRSIEPLDATGRPTSGLPYGLSAGIIGVLGTQETGYKVVLDDSVVDEKRYQAAVQKNVPAEGRPMLTVERSCRSARSVAAAWKAVGARAWSADAAKTRFTADLDPATENVVVEYDPATTSPAAAAALADLDGVEAVPTGVARMSRFNDTPKGGHWGGARITSALKNCTAGFSVVRKSNNTRASVTAGHCGGPGTTWRSGSNYYGTTSVRTNYPEYDQALITGSAYGAKIWTDGPGDSADTRTVKGGGDPAVGASVCQSGSFSTSLCGITIRSLSAKYCDSDGCTTYVIRATRNGQTAIIGGDSGGPVYSRPTSTTATIRGLAFAGSGCTASRCTTLYAERYNSITGHLGVRALTG
ncbi:S1 family peptidase [Kribbella sp. ALI-6-A]|uniref:S1 family peptidase n=1 Tax=Kribbella sp. ALI-6-A TaxID=1933817 RepID=UPI001EDC808B|nr:S1 family peptidase [Kribbella sp. ALI-6-A]